MISVADEKNLHPEIGLQLVLRFHRREIITGGNDTAVENNEIVFARDEDDLLRLTRSERKSGDETQRNPGPPDGKKHTHLRRTYGGYSISPSLLGSATFQFRLGNTCDD